MACRRSGLGYAAALAYVLLALTGFAAPPKPNPHDPQYMMGYQTGRRDERADICNKFEKHSLLATTLLGKARMILIRAFCARH